MAELRAYQPSLRDRIAWGIAGGLGRFGADKHRQRWAANKIGGLIDFVPGVGDAVGVDDAYRDYQAGNYGLAAAGLGLTAAGMIPGGDVVTQPAKKAIRAFHGSPHDFDRFDLSKIGTGEGAQAYGHGLYFAESEDVAKSYKTDLATEINIDGKPILRNNKTVGTSGDRDVDDFLIAHDGDLTRAIKEAKEYMAEAGTFGRRDAEDYAALVQKLEALEGKVETRNTGKMYEVNINADPDAFLDWDRPVSELDGAPRLVMEKELRRYLGRAYDNQIGNYVDRTAGDILGELNNPLGLRNAAVEEGIPGIKYFDSGSRGAKDGSRNYVVFDDALIEIVRKYGLAGAVAAGLISQEMAAQMQAQGIEEL